MDYITELYENPTRAGRKAFLRGVSNLDCPIDSRTNANAVHLWNDGWDKQSKHKCKGIELSDGNHSGCLGGKDCPTCLGVKS